MANILDGLELAGDAADGQEALELVETKHPDVVLMDLRMPRLAGIDTTRGLRERHPDVRVIALTTFADDESVLGSVRAGARGYLTMDSDSDQIHDAILAVASGEAALDPAVQHHLVAALASDGSTEAERGSAPDLPAGLTPRRAEVLALIAEGLTNAEIAERLVVSPTTVNSHVNHLFTKSRLLDRAQAVNFAHRTGIATPP